VLAIALSSSKSTLESTIGGRMEAMVDGGEGGGMQTSAYVEGINKDGNIWT
jgi:hypothetical protein